MLFLTNRVQICLPKFQDFKTFKCHCSLNILFADCDVISVSVEREDCISFQTRPKWMLNFMSKPCCRNLFKIADLFCHLASSYNRMAHLHTRHCWLKTGLLPTTVNSFVKMNSLRARLTSTLSTTMSANYAWTLQVISTQAGEHRWAQESSAVDMGPAATGLYQKSHIELPEKTSGLCESWWWTLRTYAKMNYLSDFGICNKSMFLDNENYKLLLIIPCRIENMA